MDSLNFLILTPRTTNTLNRCLQAKERSLLQKLVKVMTVARSPLPEVSRILFTTDCGAFKLVVSAEPNGRQEDRRCPEV